MQQNSWREIVLAVIRERIANTKFIPGMEKFSGTGLAALHSMHSLSGTEILSFMNSLLPAATSQCNYLCDALVDSSAIVESKSRAKIKENLFEQIFEFRGFSSLCAVTRFTIRQSGFPVRFHQV